MEKRSAGRFTTELAADCRSCSRSWNSRLCNISSTGCMIVCPEPCLPEGALVRLRLPGLTAIDGSIVWQHMGHAGVRFLEPLHDAVMVYLGFEGAGKTACDDTVLHVAAAPGQAGDGRHDRQIGRSWLADPAEVRAANG